MRTVRTVCAVILAAAAIGAAGCGGDDDGEAPAGDGATTARAIPSTGVPAATPQEAGACLADAGLRAQGAEPGGEEAARGAVARLDASGDGGQATITWYATEEQAFDVHSELLGSQEPNTTIGRKTEAVYVASGDDFATVGRAVTGCL